jgi:hypothetical protein
MESCYRFRCFHLFLLLFLFHGVSLTRALPAEPVATSSDPILAALKTELERELDKLDPNPVFVLEDASKSDALKVLFKTRDYVVHPSLPKGGYSVETETRVGPSEHGFLLVARVQELGVVNQLLVPQVVREPYWQTYVNVYPVKNTQKQICFCLSYGGRTQDEILKRIKKAAEQLDVNGKR